MICFIIALCFATCLFPDLLLAADQGGSNSSNIGSLSQIIAVIIALSVASERLVEIIKGWIPYLNKKFGDTPKDYWHSEDVRKALIQLMAVVGGIVTALLASPAISILLPEWTTTPHVLALGLLASGGSGFWNSIQNSVSSINKT